MSSILCGLAGMYGEQIIISTKSPNKNMSDEIRGIKDSSLFNVEHGTNGNRSFGDSNIRKKPSIKGGTMASVISPRYLEIEEGVDKPNMHDKENMEVVTNANKTTEALGLKTDSVVYIVIIGVAEFVDRTITILTNLGTTLRGICASLINIKATGNVDIEELCGSCGITIAD